MDILILERTIGELLKARPGLSRVFDAFGIDYCCGGQVTLAETCKAKGLRPQEVLDMIEDEQRKLPLEGVDSFDGKDQADESGKAAAMELSNLAGHIEKDLHPVLRSDLSRLEALTEKVARVHGSTDPRLLEVRDAFKAFTRDLLLHMEREQEILFPLIRQLESQKKMPVFHTRMLVIPICRLEMEHEDIALVLEKLRLLTDRYVPPDWACNTYRTMLEGLDRLDSGMHANIRREEEILFPRALELEKERRTNG